MIHIDRSKIYSSEDLENITPGYIVQVDMSEEHMAVAKNTGAGEAWVFCQNKSLQNVFYQRHSKEPFSDNILYKMAYNALIQGMHGERSANLIFSASNGTQETDRAIVLKLAYLIEDILFDESIVWEKKYCNGNVPIVNGYATQGSRFYGLHVDFFATCLILDHARIPISTNMMRFRAVDVLQARFEKQGGP